MAEAARTVSLKTQTLDAFNAYIADAEAGMERTLRAANDFRWIDRAPDLSTKNLSGEVIARWSASDEGPIKVPDGLIHDLMGAVVIPAANLRTTLGMLQDYDNYKNAYQPDVIDSKLISRESANFKTFLRLHCKRIVTVILDIHQDVRYRALTRTRWTMRSYVTRIAEVENPGKPNEMVLPVDTGVGILWRRAEYWRLEENEGSVYVEVRRISLTRDIPTGLGWLIEPLIRHAPKESLIRTLGSTRDGVIARSRRE